MVNAQCSRCKSIIDISFFGLNRKKEPYKTCDNCRNKNKKKPSPPCDDNVPIGDDKINEFAKRLIDLDTMRPCDDDVLSNPGKAHLLMCIGTERVEVMKEIGLLDEAIQRKIGSRYMELAEAYNNKDNQNNMNLVGEDRSYGGNLLYKDLIPRTTWFNNVRKCVTKGSWDKLRKRIYERVNYKCECCNKDCRVRKTYTGEEYEDEKITPPSDEFNAHDELSRWNTIQLEAHERWSFDYENQIQKLERIIALCHRCHTATHLGLADLRGLKQLAFKHMKKVNDWNDEQLRQHNEEQSAIWHKRNRIDWKLNIDIVTKSGIEVKPK